ncbi:MAG TPA: MotA/TolQ/ExbB proton channel family protein [Telluria sp.]|nr:MotA/TolQ/ExbB proton channel family protein [Telluria sp.]
MNGPLDSHFNLGRYWDQADGISHAVAYVLLAMSLVSWFVILSKAYSLWRVRRAAPAVDAFWAAPNSDDGIALLRAADREDVFSPLPVLAVQYGAAAGGSVAGGMSKSEQVTRVLRQQITRSTHRVENGLTLLASIGATAPFVGLLGTVWGIYHALGNVSSAGTVQIDKVAGPVGEALIMTGFGLAVAIPAVLAYNAFNRVNRITAAELDGFAHDLLARFGK